MSAHCYLRAMERHIELPPDWDEPSDFGPQPLFTDRLLPDGRVLVLGERPAGDAHKSRESALAEPTALRMTNLGNWPA